MIEALLVVLSNPVDGREADFNDWYSHVHLRDTMRFRGSIAAQRFHFSDTQVQEWSNGFHAQYLALYESFDAARFTQEHMDNAMSKRMVISDSIDLLSSSDYYYYPLQFRCRAPRQAGVGSVILEQIAVDLDLRAAFEDWYNNFYMPQCLQRDGVLSGAFLSYFPHGQLIDGLPPHSHVGIYRLSDDAARAQWRAPTLGDCPFVQRNSLAVTCWDAHIPRMTEDDVHHTTAKALAEEERVRASIGDRIHQGIREQMRD